MTCWFCILKQIKTRSFKKLFLILLPTLFWAPTFHLPKIGISPSNRFRTKPARNRDNKYRNNYSVINISYMQFLHKSSHDHVT